MNELDRTFAALADPTRRQVVDLLRTGERRAGELADELGMSPPAMSRHLRILRTSGLVEESHDGHDARVRMYRLRQRPFGQVREWVEEVERFWAGELASFKQHAERKSGAPRRKP
ncbi:MAG TPA: metalloregulator ArsR/SmtB family transcription factor [Kofleriaceae bacterium]|nr:metalloregulator ArsR/SmtB family transcription factor [Kofleriaceae bacterium]